MIFSARLFPADWMVSNYLLLTILGFLLGNFMFSAQLPRLLWHVDVTEGTEDQNPGVFNAFHAVGPVRGSLCLILDLLKGFLPVYLAAHTLDTQMLAMTAVMTAPVLGHALGLWNHHHGGKCITTTFGVLLGLLPISPAVYLLALLYILFSVAVKITPNLLKSLITFTLFMAISVPHELYHHRGSMALGCFFITMIVMVKHLMDPGTQNLFAEDDQSMKARTIRYLQKLVTKRS